MKKLLLLSFSFAVAMAASATDIWVWNNGQYQQMTADSITFEKPESSDPEVSIDTTKNDTAVVTPVDTTNNDSTTVTPTDSLKQDSVDAATAISKTYSGSMALTLAGSSYGATSTSATISKISDGVVKIEFGDFTALFYTVSGFTADSVTVTGPDANGGYTLSQSGFSSDVTLSGSKNKATDCTLTGTVDNKGNISISVSFTASGIAVVGDFTGK